MFFISSECYFMKKAFSLNFICSSVFLYHVSTNKFFTFYPVLYEMFPVAVSLLEGFGCHTLYDSDLLFRKKYHIIITTTHSVVVFNSYYIYIQIFQLNHSISILKSQLKICDGGFLWKLLQIFTKNLCLRCLTEF